MESGEYKSKYVSTFFRPCCSRVVISVMKKNLPANTIRIQEINQMLLKENTTEAKLNSKIREIEAENQSRKSIIENIKTTGHITTKEFKSRKESYNRSIRDFREEMKILNHQIIEKKAALKAIIRELNTNYSLFEKIFSLISTLKLNSVILLEFVKIFPTESKQTNQLGDDFLYDDALNDFICPITMSVMADPMITPCKHNFERSAINDWFSRENTTCPCCRTKVEKMEITPDPSLRSRIIQWRKKKLDSTSEKIDYHNAVLLQPLDHKKHQNTENLEADIKNLTLKKEKLHNEIQKIQNELHEKTLEFDSLNMQINKLKHAKIIKLKQKLNILKEHEKGRKLNGDQEKAKMNFLIEIDQLEKSLNASQANTENLNLNPHSSLKFQKK